MKLSQYHRSTIMSLLEQQKALAKPISFLPILKLGVTEKQIRMIDYVSQILQKAPFLTLDELRSEGMSLSELNNTIGSLNDFKGLLGLSEYSFSDWLVAQGLCYSADKGIAIPYLIYQMFFEEIRKFHTVQNRLEAGLKVELDSGARFSSVSLFGTSDTMIPVDDYDALLLAKTLLSEHYQIIDEDKSRSCLQLQKIGSSAVKDVEIRCLSSSLSKATVGGIYLFDDVKMSSRSQHNYLLYAFSNLINQHHRHWHVVA